MGPSEEAQLSQTRSTNPCTNHKVPSLYRALWKELGQTKVNQVPAVGARQCRGGDTNRNWKMYPMSEQMIKTLSLPTSKCTTDGRSLSPDWLLSPHVLIAWDTVGAAWPRLGENAQKPIKL